jgi:hypothetical protein
MASFTTLLIALVLSPAVASDAQLPKIRNSAENAGHANSGPPVLGPTNNHTVSQDPAGLLLDVNLFLDVNSTLTMPLLDALSGNMTSSQLVGVLAVFASARAAVPMDQTSEERAGDAGSAPAGLRGAVDQAKAAEAARTGNFTTVAGFFPHYHPHRGTRNICSGVAGAGFYCTRGGTTLVRCCGSAVGTSMCGALQGCCGYHVGGGAYLAERCMTR